MKYGNSQWQAKTSSYQEPGFPQYPYQSGGYPPTTPQYPVPYGQTQSPASEGLGSKFNDIKGIIDRMGGIDGILDTVGKVNKFMQTMQQMGPMLRLLFNSFGGAKATTAKSYEDLPTRRKRSTSRNTRRGPRKTKTRTVSSRSRIYTPSKSTASSKLRQRQR